MHRTREKMKMAKLVSEKQKMGERTARINVQKKANKVHFSNTKNTQQVVLNFFISVCSTT